MVYVWILLQRLYISYVFVIITRIFRFHHLLLGLHIDSLYICIFHSLPSWVLRWAVSLDFLQYVLEHPTILQLNCGVDLCFTICPSSLLGKVKYSMQCSHLNLFVTRVYSCFCRERAVSKPLLHTSQVATLFWGGVKDGFAIVKMAKPSFTPPPE